MTFNSELAARDVRDLVTLYEEKNAAGSHAARIAFAPGGYEN